MVPTCQGEAVETPVPGSVQGHVGRGPEQRGLVSGISTRGRELEQYDSKVLSNPHHSMIQVKCVLRSAQSWATCRLWADYVHPSRPLRLMLTSWRGFLSTFQSAVECDFPSRT